MGAFTNMGALSVFYDKRLLFQRIKLAFLRSSVSAYIPEKTSSNMKMIKNMTMSQMLRDLASKPVKI